MFAPVVASGAAKIATPLTQLITAQKKPSFFGL